MWRRAFRILDALSQLGNSVWCFLWAIDDTTANESISGRAYRQSQGIRHVINAIFFWQDNHCREAYLKDIERAKALVEMHNARI